MTKLRDIRVLPVTLVAIAALAVLKIMGLALNGGYVFVDRFGSQDESGGRQPSWAQVMFNFPGGHPANADGGDVTGSVGNRSTSEATDSKDQPDHGAVVVSPNNDKPISSEERAILERLQSRRQELDARARELEIRENLIKASEKKMRNRSDEMKSREEHIASAGHKKEEAAVQRLKSLVIMYENMKPKDAAKIFDRLDLKILYDVVAQINPRKMADILAQMSPEIAERLTVEIANRAGLAERSASAADLPKIEGRPINVQ